MPGHEKSSRILGTTNKEKGKSDKHLWISSRGGTEVELRGMAEGCRSARLTIASSPVKIPPIPLKNRKSLAIFVPAEADGFSGILYLGGPGLNADNGFPLPTGGYFFLDVEANVYAFATEIVDIRILEGA